MSERTRGIAFAFSAYGIWGLFPLYWPLLAPSGAGEILAHRIMWSLVVVLAILGVRKQWAWVADYARDRRRLMLLTVAAVLIAINWLAYIYGVNSGHVVETALGYFINPLLSVLLGVVVLGERLRRAQWAALGLAGAAVVVLTADYGRPPLIAFAIATSFGAYGLVKKQANAGAVEGLTIETAVLVVPAFIYVVTLHATGKAAFGHHGLGHALLLAGGGLVTAVPLLFFGGALTRVPLSFLGVLQYGTPMTQFAIGVLLRHEPMPAARLAGFGLVWVALALFTAESIVQHRRGISQSPHRQEQPVAGD